MKAKLKTHQAPFALTFQMVLDGKTDTPDDFDFYIEELNVCTEICSCSLAALNEGERLTISSASS